MRAFQRSHALLNAGLESTPLLRTEVEVIHRGVGGNPERGNRAGLESSLLLADAVMV